MTNHAFYMDLALQNARAMKGQTDPNPLVGAVIVNNNRIVGIGAHMKPGEPHAEIHAIRMAGEHAKGATIYVTLEPCSHHGRTGPCAEAIVAAGIKTVVIATLDPNPIVSGRGVKILEDAGINVVTGIQEEASKRMNEVFNKFIVTEKPFVTLKSGITLDGKIATHSAHSKWITSADARDKKEKLINQGVQVFHTTGTTHVDVQEVVQLLGEKSISSLLIEGGGTINAAFLENKLIDKAVIYIAPKLIGGKNAPTFMEGSGIDLMSDAVELIDTEIQKIGKDFKFVGYPTYK